ncbi:hypothetical protein [Marinospirillum sp.]|uniref:hypothetical protein n=1 Tax=Marinospirillum sp. TaxID=2183934 RepID=UPI00286FBD61|nr:hypothetical protein [Marinospirillum sp.]MDR9469071.1 hypothetical protein [Marinospirillum sp.]
MSLLPLDFPELCRDQLESCATRKDALEAWLQKLPLAHPLASQEKLSQLLGEFNQLHFPPPRRLEWLKLITRKVNQVCKELDQGHHLAGEGEAAQLLEKQLSQGYKRTLNDLLNQRSQLPTAILGPSLLEALFYALTHTGALIARSCRFSVTAPEKIWRELYLLYRLACQSKLQHREIQPDQAPHNCEQAYHQALLLGIIQAENLRSDEVALLYPYLGEWGQLLLLTAANSPDAQFQVLASCDFLPQRSQADNRVNSEQDFGLNTRQVSDELARQLEKEHSPFSNRLLQHLLALLSEASERNAPRLEATGTIKLVLGLRSVHFHLSGKKPFEQLAAGGNLSVQTRSNPFLQEVHSDDPWSAAHDAAENKSTGQVQLVDMETTHLSTSLDEELDKRYPTHLLNQVNTSATGYCLSWPGEAPKSLATGELIALKEKPTDPWQPAVIRWVRQAPEGYQLGAELLPSRMQPCAIKPIIKMGDPVGYMPGFLVPELKVLGTPASVITPLLPFREGQKVDITAQQGKQRAKLVRLLSTPGEFNQFQLESLGTGGLGYH